MICYWCYWGWPKPIRDIFEAARVKLGGNIEPLLYGPAHIVWDDENFDSAQHCLDHFDEYAGDLTEYEKSVVRESLEMLLAVSNEFKNEPEEYDGHNPGLYPPPEHWQCELDVMMNREKFMQDNIEHE